MTVGYQVLKREERVRKKRNEREDWIWSSKFFVWFDFDWATGWRKEGHGQLPVSCPEKRCRKNVNQESSKLST